MDDRQTPVPVTLPESLLLLVTDDVTGQISTKSGALNYGLAGAVLTDLLLRGRLDAEEGKLRVIDSSPLGDSVLDHALSRMGASKSRDAKHWVGTLARDHIMERVLEHLLQKGVLRREEHRILWVIPNDRYPTEDTAAERAVRENVRAVVLEGAPPQPRTAVLIALLKACDLADVVFSRDERKHYKERIDDVARGEAMGEAVARAIKEMQAAVIAAVVAAGAAAASSAATS
jgi:hypothetical protein